MSIRPGLYEQPINQLLESILQNLDEGHSKTTRPLTTPDSRHILAKYLTEIIEQALQNVGDHDNLLENQIDTANEIIRLLSVRAEDSDLTEYQISPQHSELLSIYHKKSGEIPRPETSLSTSTLFTGSKLEPSMMNELKKEILSSTKIDFIVSFIKWSGLRLIIEELKEFTKEHKLRIITTSYMGATDLKAIVELAKLPNTEIKISYDTRTTRLHAKSYLFQRETGFSTAYVGSSNISNAALGSGLEWNVKITEKDLPHIIKNISATFDQYWNDRDFQTFTLADTEQLREALQAEKATGEAINYQFTITPYPFQKDILDKLEAERKVHNRKRNLLVAATGTGKTVISAFDYQRYCKEHPDKPNRLLFIAHRLDILKQSLLCFRGILRDANFGDLFDGNNKPKNLDHVFVSIQTFNSQKLEKILKPEFYDFIIIDEFHHAEAKSYQTLLNHFKPEILLGLTATPERMDGKDICQDYFNGIISAQIRLPEAINRQLLCPFQYFCITDTVDLSHVRFEMGRYVASELEELYLENKQRADAILQSVDRYVTDISQVIGLGFCAGVKHAEFMAESFTKAGIPSVSLNGSSSVEERERAKKQLTKKEIHFIFTADLFNEGVDIPEVNTLLFLRPTESLTIFLQQLGRGLRLCEGKDVVTVLDFIGAANKKYSFEWKFRALMDKTKNPVRREIEHGFTSLPSGCFIQMEKVAQQTILDNITSQLLNKKELVRRVKNFEAETGEKPTLSAFLAKYELSLEDIYQKKRGPFWKLCEEAEVYYSDGDIDTKTYAPAFMRISQMNSKRWISFVLDVLEGTVSPINDEEKQMILMLFYLIYDRTTPESMGLSSVEEIISHILSIKPLANELIECLHILYNEIDFVDTQIDVGLPCPLDVGCSYPSQAILAGVGYYRVDMCTPLTEGAFYFTNRNTDLLFITLNKSEDHYSPTAMYDDYVISDSLIHWQSQSRTAEHSRVGQRYIHHDELGSQVLLFVRETKTRNGFTLPYVYLGKAHYVEGHGSKPMNVVWRLEEKMSSRLYLELKGE